MDLRGHGLSDKPRDAYGDSRLWADDVASIIDALNLDRPVLSGWSYGPLVTMDVVAEARPCDIARGTENGIWVVRADVAGVIGELSSLGSSRIVSPDGSIVMEAQELAEDLLVGDVGLVTT